MAKELAIGVITSFRVSPLEALTAVRELGIPTVQLSYPGALDNDAGIQAIFDAVAATGIEITSVVCGFRGESYADIPMVRRTVGLVPLETRAERVDRVDIISLFAQRIGVNRVCAHIGFVPERANAEYGPIVETIRGICDRLALRGQVFALETGQETALALREFIGDVARPNLKVNFDPANMILYGNDDPIKAMDELAPFIDGVHCKDGTWPTEPDRLGHETPLGEGDVDVPRWIERLLSAGYRGPMTIEREIHGEAQRRDILRAKELIEQILAGSRQVTAQ